MEEEVLFEMEEEERYQNLPLGFRQLGFGLGLALETRYEYVNGRTYLHIIHELGQRMYELAEPGTDFFDDENNSSGFYEDGHSQFYDEDISNKELISRDKTISKHLKARTYVKPKKDHVKSEVEAEICVICQAEYEDNEEIGSLHCGHEYHAHCIRKWLRRKIVCPLCNAKAFPTKI